MVRRRCISLLLLSLRLLAGQKKYSLLPSSCFVAIGAPFQ